MIGGPVQQSEMFWAVHSSDYENEATTSISKQLRLSSAQDVIRALAEEHGPSRYLLGCGYSGWGAEQLDREIQEEIWWLSPLDAELVMDLEHDQRWEWALNSIGIDPLTASFVKAGTV
jgi:putative transcriptional regulator